MNKLLFIAIAAIALCSCTGNQEAKRDTMVYADDSTHYVCVNHYHYKNHSYIRFGWEHSGWVHDPDCNYCLSSFE